MDGVTQELRRALKVSQQGLCEQWAAAGFQGDTTHESAVLNSAALGEFKAYSMIEEMIADYEKFSSILEYEDEE